MHDVSTFRLHLLRAMYLLVALGLGLTIWPLILSPPDTVADHRTVIWSLLGALGLLMLLGLRYPLKMLPLMLFELLWKLVWVLAFALRMWRDTGLDDYASETLFACLIGVVLVPLVLPWRYLLDQYVRAPGDRWRGRPDPAAVPTVPGTTG